MAITSTPKIFFKKGTQTKFNTLLAATGDQFVEGTLYLTDIGNLYYANGSTKNDIIQLHSGLHVENTTTMSQAYLNNTYGAQNLIGDFFYSETENILIYKKGENNYVQVNPYAALETTANGLTLEPGETTTTKTISLNISDTQEHTVTGSIDLIQGDNVLLEIDKDNQGNDIPNTLKISALDTNTTYSITATNNIVNQQQQVNINLNGSDGTSSTLALMGTDGVSVTATNAGIIKITGTPTLKSISNGFDTDGKFTTVIEQGTTAVVSNEITPTIKYKAYNASNVLGYNATAVFEQEENSVVPTLSLDVYDTAAVDKLIDNAKKELNAMTYKGPMTTSAFRAQMTATNNQNGDTYRAVEDIRTGDDNQILVAKAGDLIIYKGTDNGTFTYSGNATNDSIEVVSSGDEQLLYLSLDASDNTITFNDRNAPHTNNPAVVGHIQFTNTRSTENANINISSQLDPNDSTSSTYQINIAHGGPGTGTEVTKTTPAVNWSMGQGLTIPGITSLSKDAQGHITAITIKEYKIPQDKSDFEAIDIEPVTTTSGADVEMNLPFQMTRYDGSTKSDSHTLRLFSNSLSVSVTAPGEAGTRLTGTFNVELEWGSF